MSIEKQLICKSYFETFTEGIKDVHPIKVLGELYMVEKQNEVPDLSDIRFAQGEIYFQNKDYEAAIFKWDNISNELKPWAQKNIADAHYELDLLAIAEDHYKAVETDSDVLKIEVLLQLFSLYIQLGKRELAVDSIKRAVDLNPDYPDVTDIARTFFEENQDYDNAIELAVNEAIRTESLSWFAVLEQYANQGHTNNHQPNYFKNVLLTLQGLNHIRFENLIAAIWKTYKHQELYFPWLTEINELLMEVELEQSYTWKELSSLYKETYFDLIAGQYFIQEISEIVPKHLTNWLQFATDSDALISSSAVLAWNEMFTSSFDPAVIREAESIVTRTPHTLNHIENVVELFDSISNWAEDNNVHLSQRFGSIVQELLDIDHHHLMVAGTVTSGKSSFINELLGEEILEGATSATVLFKDADQFELDMTTDEAVTSITDLQEFREFAKKPQTFLRCQVPNNFLNSNKIALIDTPGFSGQTNARQEVFQSLHLADSMLFVLSAESILTGKELDMAIRIKEQAPALPIHFLLSKMDRIATSKELMALVEETTERISNYFPEAKVFAFSTYENQSLRNELAALVKPMNISELEKSRIDNILSYVKKSIQFLFDQRMKLEDSFVSKIEWNEETVKKLQGAVHQLSDMEEEKVKVITESYRQIKADLRQDLLKQIPECIRNCSELVTEDTNFGKIHIELNEKMNKQIQNHLEQKALPNFRKAIQEWIEQNDAELQAVQTYLDEMNESFNLLYGDEKIALACDDKVLDDWCRDADRMTRGSIPLDKANILMRFTPSQVLLKGAGKLFGAIPQNKGLLHNKYKQFIENQDYSEVATSITDTFIQQFDLFEKSLEHEISMFFTSPYQELNRTLEEAQYAIERYDQALNDMRKNPELYRDPLNLFELKYRQYQWMLYAGNEEKPLVLEQL